MLNHFPPNPPGLRALSSGWSCSWHQACLDRLTIWNNRLSQLNSKRREVEGHFPPEKPGAVVDDTCEKWPDLIITAQCNKGRRGGAAGPRRPGCSARCSRWQHPVIWIEDCNSEGFQTFKGGLKGCFSANVNMLDGGKVAHVHRRSVRAGRQD